MDVLKKHLLDLKSEMDYELLVIDSLAVLETIAEMRNRRTDMFHFFGWLKNLGVTTFIISEISPNLDVVHDEDYLAMLLTDIVAARRVRKITADV